MSTDLEAIKGIGPLTAKKLQEAGISSAEVLSYQEPHDVWRKTGLSLDTVEKLIARARGFLPFTEFRPATEVEVEHESRHQLSTGIPMVDSRLQGGIHGGSLVEFYGAAGTGKSHWCHQLAVTSQLPTERGGLGGKVLWIDTEGSFSSLIIRVMTKRFGLDPDGVLSNITTMYMMNEEHMVGCRDMLSALCTDKVGLLVVDSLGKLFKMELVRPSNYEMSRARLATLLDRFQDIAVTTGVTIIYTNRIYQKQAYSVPGFMTAALNGKYMAHMANYRFKLTDSTSYNSKIHLENHVSTPPFEVGLSLDWGGFYHQRDKDQISTLTAFAESCINNTPD